MSEIFSKILKDKNGKVLNVGSKYQQPDWGVEENGVIFPEAMLEVDPEVEGAVIANPFNQYLETGKTYTVNYNGVNYECIAVELAGEGHALGNISMIGLSETATDEPFVMVAFNAIVAAENNAYAVVMPTDGSASFSLSISGEVVHAIPSKYINGGVYAVNVKTNDLGNNICEFDASFEEIIIAITGGKQVYAINNGITYPLTSYDANNVTFAGHTYFDSSKTMFSIFRLHIDDGGTWTSYRVKSAAAT